MKRAVLALALVACKADLHHTVDALPLDTSIDALSQQGDPPPNAVKLTVTLRGEPVHDMPVYFQSADSTPISSSLTNDHGVAWAIMPAGGFVTAIDHEGTNLDHLTTFAAVQPAEALELDLSPTGVTSEHLIHIILPTVSNATSYEVHAPCGETTIASTTADVALVGCENFTDLVIVALDGQGEPIGAIFAPGINLDNNPTTIPGTYQNFADVSLDYTNLPSSVAAIGIYEALSASHRAFSVNTTAIPANGTAQVAISIPASSTSELTASNLFPTAGEIGMQTIYNWHPSLASVNLDVGAVLLAPYATPPQYEVASRRIVYTTRTGAQPDLVRAGIHVVRDGIPASRVWSWRIVAPVEATAITYPRLPAIDFDYNPLGGDTVSIDELTTLALPGGFAGFHARGFAEPRNAISGTLGRIVQQDLYFEPL